MSSRGFSCRLIAVAAPLSLALIPGSSALADAMPPVAWSRQIGSLSFDFGYGLTVDGSGNVLITGEAGASLGGPSHGSPDAFVAKYDATGTLLWSRQLGTSATDTGQSIAADATGNVFIAGSTSGGLDGASAGNRDAFLTKYDAAGGIQWTRQVGTSSDDFGRSVKTDAVGNVYLTGFTGGTIAAGGGGGPTDAFIRKYDTSGNLLWTRQFGTQYSDEGHSMAVDTSGNVFATGYTVGNLGGPNAGSNDAYVRKYDADGNTLWTRQFGTSDAEEGNSITADTAGNVYVTGYTQGSLGGPHAGGFFDAYVRKYDADGDVVWTRQIGNANSQRTFSVTVDAAGSVFITGSTSGVLGEAGFGGTDTFITKYDAAGNLLWTHQLGTSGSDVGRGLWVDASGNVLYLLGDTAGALGGTPAGWAGTTDAYLFKFAVPEPGSLTLLLGGAAMMMRRRGLA